MANFEIINGSQANWEPEELYEMILSRDIDTFKNHIDETFTVQKWLIYRDNDAEVEILSIKTDKGVISGNSRTIMEDLQNIWDIFGEGVAITIKSNVSKNGRNFCYLVH